MKECSKCRSCYEDDITVCPIDNATPSITITGSTTISGRYILQSRLGEGGMGIVFRAKHKFLKSSHAVKIILPSLVDGDKDLLVRFNQEAVLAASIDHPNVIRVTDFGVENDVMPYLVMEFIDGVPLSSFLTDKKPLDLKQAFDLFIPAAEGVAEAHSKGIVHRDLKPQNIMVQKNLPPKKAVKVLDFGLAKIKAGDSYASLIQAKTMNIVGSPPYMSPEQWAGEGVDQRTDIYALAVLLFQMITGRLPFQADSMPAMMYQHLNAQPPTAASLGISLPAGLEEIVRKALEKDPARRYDTMDLMLEDLNNVIEIQEIRRLTGASTEYMVSRSSLAPGKHDTVGATPLSDSQKEKFYAHFDPEDKRAAIADPKLAHEFLDAQDRIEQAITEVVNADQLVLELAEAQKEAEAAQNKAIRAKERIEADVRRQVEAEMQRLGREDSAKREAEARHLAEEIEARRVAEERANYLAQAALEAQQLAESERKKREEEAQQRELHQNVRRNAEIEAKQLAEQVAESQRQYEEAKNEAAREAGFRAEAEARQKKIESEIEALAYNEAERRKLVEASAKKYIEDQAARYERDAQAAKQRLDEAQVLIDQEAGRREQAEAARIEAEKEAERLSQEIIAVQRQMDEMRQHITYDTQGRGMPTFPSVSGQSLGGTGSKLAPLTQRSGQMSREIPSGLFSTGQISARKSIVAALVIGVVSVLVLSGGVVGLYFYTKKPVQQPVNDKPVVIEPAKPIDRKLADIPGGNFKMGRDDIDNKKDELWGNQYPSHQETVQPFQIDVYETTNAQYAEFVKDTKHPAPSYWVDRSPPKPLENFPVTNVTLADAKAYADWLSKRENKKYRLPTEIEWEYVARNGKQDTTFPWEGDSLNDFARLSGRDALPVGSTKDETIVGNVKDMLGNVSEWTSTTFSMYKGHPFPEKSDKQFVVRGLSFKSSTEPKLSQKPELMLTSRARVAADSQYDFLGFRLVREP